MTDFKEGEHEDPLVEFVNLPAVPEQYRAPFEHHLLDAVDALRKCMAIVEELGCETLDFDMEPFNVVVKRVV